MIYIFSLLNYLMASQAIFSFPCCTICQFYKANRCGFTPLHYIDGNHDKPVNLLVIIFCRSASQIFDQIFDKAIESNSQLNPIILIYYFLSHKWKYFDMIYYDHYCPTFLVDNFSSRFKIVLLDQWSTLRVLFLLRHIWQPHVFSLLYLFWREET